MTESDWLNATKPQEMLSFLREGNMLSPRKASLFAAACFRHLTHLLPDTRQHMGIDTLERMGEGTATLEMRRAAATGARSAMPASSDDARAAGTDDPHFVALMLYRAFVSRDAAGHAAHAHGDLADWASEGEEHCRLLRDIFGNPFREMSAVDPTWLTWNNGIIKQLAESAYEERALPS